jgi:hypothetical protein
MVIGSASDAAPARENNPARRQVQRRARQTACELDGYQDLAAI